MQAPLLSFPPFPISRPGLSDKSGFSSQQSVRLEMPKMYSYVKAGIPADELSKTDLWLFLPGY